MTQTLAHQAERLASSARPNEEGPIVLATKPFDSTDAPLAVAQWLAHREDRDLHVVSVLEQRDALATAAGAPPLPPRYYEEERASIAARMSDSLAAETKSGINYRVDVLDGPCARTVVEVAHDRGARVIVIGTGKHDSLGRFVYGERALQIVRLADRPVLVVPRGASSGTIHKAIVAVDFSPVSLRAARAVIPMLSDGSTLTLVHVKPAAPAMDDHTGSWNKSNELRCDTLFRRFMKLLPVPPGITVETRLLWGDAAVALQQFAARSQADMLACGRRHSHSLIERFLVGSVSAALVRTVTCPILIAPESRDDTAAELNVTLTGMDTCPQDAWPAMLNEFTHRNRGRRVRLSVDVDAAGGGQCVAQDYVLRSVTYDATDELLTILLADASRANSLLSMKYSDASAVTSFSDVAGRDTRLVLEASVGRCTLTFADERLV